MRSSDSSAPYAAAWAQDIDEEEDDENTIRVLVTGFGPFRDHTVNASWEAVKLINPDDIIMLSRHGRESAEEDFMANQPTIQITFCELEVVYNTINQVIPDLWEKYKPHVSEIGHNKLFIVLTVGKKVSITKDMLLINF